MQYWPSFNEKLDDPSFIMNFRPRDFQSGQFYTFLDLVDIHDTLLGRHVAELALVSCALAHPQA
jgi:hypothetical protein